ncbi:transcription initiation factor IIB [Marasmius tenuissimus]|uniref:Transcription initiation factor IIB n=1 Tax=Marasmius tenuissimus TaxID=585030 RepID=A0ABR2ZEB9_9AGAR
MAGDDGGDPSRVGVAEDPITEGVNKLSTVIGVQDGGSGLARELQRAASRSQNSRSQRKLTTAFRDITNWCDQFSLSKDVGDIAKQLYKRLDEEKLLRGKPLEAVLAACVFIACRQARVPRTFGEICSLTHVTKKALSQCCKALERAFNLKPIPSQVAQSSESSEPSVSPPEPALPSNPEALVSRYCNQLDLPYYVEIYCADVIITARELGIAEGRKPASIAGGAIYFTSCLVGQERSLKEISDVTGVSEGTIELVFHSYRKEKNNLVKEGWVEEGRAQLDRLPSPDSDDE